MPDNKNMEVAALKNIANSFKTTIFGKKFFYTS